MNFKFNNWRLISPKFLAQQFDNLTRQIAVEGEIPAGWSWSALVSAAGNNDVITLYPAENGLCADLTDDMLAFGNEYYYFQLRAENGEKTKHTNVVTVYIPASLSGHGEWPELPSEFAQAEARLRDIASHPPIPGADGEHWALWSYELQEYVLSDFPLPEGSGGSFNIHSLTAEDDLADADETAFYDDSAQTQRKTTWQNIKAKLKAYFDDLFVSKVAGKGLSTNDYTDEDKEKVSTAIPEAPIDGKQYARKDGAWAEVHGGGGQGWTTEQIDLLEAVFEKLGFTDAEGVAIAAMLIDSLRGGVVPEEPITITFDGTTAVISGLASLNTTFSGTTAIIGG